MSDRRDLDAIVELFVRWRDGDSRAMDDLVRKMTPVLWHTVRAYGLSQTQAEDAIQVTWLALVRGHDAISVPGAVVAWLVTTARREAWKVSRNERREAPSDDLEPYLLPKSSAEADAAERLERDRLWSAVNTLDERCRRLLRVVAFAVRPDYSRVASELRMPVGSIGPTRRRCLDKLRTALDASGEVALE